MRKIFLLLLLTTFAFSTAETNSELYGILTLTPPFLAIVLAFATKNVVLSLFIGVFSGTYLTSFSENGFFTAFFKAYSGFIHKAISSLADPWNAGIVLQVFAIGGVVALVTKMGGAKAIAIILRRKAKSLKSAQLYTWTMGMMIFFDDFANSLIVGPVMRPVTDRFKLSREKLAFIIDSTAAPLAGIAIISTWIGLEVSLIRDAYSIIGEEVNAFGIFVQTIPYRFYNIFMLSFVVISALTLRDFGPMYKAQIKAINSKVKYNNNIDIPAEEKELEPEQKTKLRPSNAIIPIGVLIFSAFIGFYLDGLGNLTGDDLAYVQSHGFSFEVVKLAFGQADASIVLFQAAILSTIVAIFMGVKRKIFSLAEAIDIWIKGWKTMVITIVILVLAWSLSSVIKDLGTSLYLVKVLSSATPKVLLPALIFILSSFISFSIGTSYGTMGILMPLAVPLSYAVGVDSALADAELHKYMLMGVSAVLTGAIFGDHCSPISSTSILASYGSKCPLMDHVRTQFPYALTVCGISIIVGYLPVAMGLNVFLTLALGLLAVFLTIRFIGKKVV